MSSTQKLRLYLKACLDDLDRVRNAENDAILRGNALADVRKHLHALWELVERDPYSELFEEVVQALQSALCIEETLTSAQLDAVRSVLSRMHDDPNVDEETANAMTQELVRSGLDIFRACKFGD